MRQKSSDFFQSYRIFMSLHPLRLDYHWVLDNFDKYQYNYNTSSDGPAKFAIKHIYYPIIMLVTRT